VKIPCIEGTNAARKSNTACAYMKLVNRGEKQKLRGKD